MKKSPRVFGSMVLLLAGSVMAQVVLPPPNAQGWIKLFRGNNPGDFYTFYSGVFPSARRSGPANFPDNTFRIVGDTVQVTGSPTGHMIFKQSFSHYRIRYQMRFPGSLGNCGMLVHIQENDSAMWNTFPRSVESQGDPNQGMGQIWAIGRVWVTVRATGTNPPRYDAAAPEIDWGARDDNSRLIYTSAGGGQPRPTELNNGGWVTQEADIRAGDSLSHIVMGQTLIRYRRPRVAPRNAPNTVEKLLTSGLIAWQSEGTAVWYRNIEIMLYPQDPMYQPTYVDFNRRNTITPMPSRKISLAPDGIVTLAAGRFDLRGHRVSLRVDR